jgi:hypothetical protein
MTDVNLLNGEQLAFDLPDQKLQAAVSDAAISEKYVRGEVRIVTEQARYPLNTIASMVGSSSYTLSPEYQRRRRWSAVRQSRLIESLIAAMTFALSLWLNCCGCFRQHPL